MECPSDSSLIAHVDGAGGEAERAALQRHVMDCTACQRLIADYETRRARIAGAFDLMSSARCEACPDVEELDCFVERPATISSPNRAAIEKHVQQCVNCSEYVAGLRRWLALADEPPVSQRQLRNIIEKATAPGPKLTRIRWGMPVAVSALTGIMLLLVSRGVIEMQRGGGQPERLGDAGADNIESRQTETQRTTSAPNVGDQPSRQSRREAVGTLSPNAAASAASETERTRSLGGTKSGATLTLRVKTRAGVEDLPLPSTRELSLASGCEYGFRLEPRSSARWVYLFQVDSAGTVSVLFPNTRLGTSANPVVAPSGLSLPSESSWYQLDNITGKEEVYAFLTDSPCQECQQIVTLAGETTGSAAEAALKELSRRAASRRDSSAYLRMVVFRFLHR